MARWRGSSTERGYGYDHKTERERRLAIYRPGDICANGGEPLQVPPSMAAEYLDLPHTDDRSGYLPGLSCRKHNRGDGASRSNHGQPRLILAAGHDTICTACGQPYHYAARSCEICGGHYHPNRGGQRTCGRTCGAVLQKRNRMAKGWIPPAQRPKPPPKLHHFTCRYCQQQFTVKAGGSPREVCEARRCQLLRQRAGVWRVRYGLTQAEADSAVLADCRPRLSPPLRGRSHDCPGCGKPAPGSYRWCPACLCVSLNGKGRRCGNAAEAGGLCSFHAAASEQKVVTDGHRSAVTTRRR